MRRSTLALLGGLGVLAALRLLEGDYRGPTVVLPGPAGGVGLGDLVKGATSAVGVAPCPPCQRRAETLNRMVRIGA